MLERDQMRAKKASLTDLISDDKNANRGTVRGLGMLEKSLRQYGAGRSILVDKKNRIIAGNKTVEAATGMGLEDAIVIENDGTKVVVVRRTDINLDSAEGRGLAIADNRVAEVGLEWDTDALGQLQGDVDLSQFFFEGELPELDIDFEADPMPRPEFRFEPDDGAESHVYTQKVVSPIYEPTEEKPELVELFDSEKTDKLISEINDSKIPKKIKEFLKIAAHRHTVFDYQQIAEYYAHADAEVQNLMEKSALIIVDYNDAIANGFVRMTHDIKSTIETSDDE